jgi:hypothetical protein
MGLGQKLKAVHKGKRFRQIGERDQLFVRPDLRRGTQFDLSRIPS